MDRIRAAKSKRVGTSEQLCRERTKTGAERRWLGRHSAWEVSGGEMRDPRMVSERRASRAFAGPGRPRTGRRASLRCSSCAAERKLQRIDRRGGDRAGRAGTKYPGPCQFE